MKKKLLFGFFLPACAVALLGAVTVNGVKLFKSYADFTLISAPSNPVSGVLRVFGNTSSTKLGCIDSTGANCLPAGGAGGNSITFIQMANVRGNSVGSLAYPFNVTSGDILIIGLGWESGAATDSSITDTLSTSFTRIVQTTGGTSNCALFAGQASSSGANTVTVTTPAGSGFNGIFNSEFSNLSTTLDGTPFTGASVPSNAVTTAVDGDLIVTMIQSNTSSSPPPSAWGAFIGQFNAGNDTGFLGWYIQPKAGTVQTWIPAASTITNCSMALEHP